MATEAARAVRVRVVAFAGLREIVGPSAEVDVAAPATVATLWETLIARHPALAAHRASARTARGDAFATDATPLVDGDEVALLPPVGGG